MNAAIRFDTGSSQAPISMAVVVSAVLHIGIVILGLVGLPHIQKPILPPEPISVEIVDIAELSQTDKKPAVTKRIEKPIEKKAEPVEDKPPAPPKVVLNEPPKLKIDPQPLKKEPPKEEIKKVVEPTPEPVKLDKPKSKPIPPPPKEIVQQQPPPPKEDIVEEQVQEDTSQDFASLLKNLQEGAAPQPQDVAEEISPEAQPSPLAQFANRVTQGEMDAMRAALNRQFSGCWNLSAGAKYAEDINVQVRLYINPDRTVRDVRIVEQLRYAQDNFYRAAADNVIRAIRHPACEILDLPPDRYEFWKDSIFNFNPSQML